MRIDDIGGSGPAEQLAYFPAVVFAQRLDAGPGQHAGQIGLRAAIAPDLANHRRAGPQRCCLLLEHAQLGSQKAITTVNSDQRPGVEDRLHATS